MSELVFKTCLLTNQLQKSGIESRSRPSAVKEMCIDTARLFERAAYDFLRLQKSFRILDEQSVR